jgi:hypothetical protein
MNHLATLRQQNHVLNPSVSAIMVQGGQIFLGTTYQNGEKYTK